MIDCRAWRLGQRHRHGILSLATTDHDAEHALRWQPVSNLPADSRAIVGMKESSIPWHSHGCLPFAAMDSARIDKASGSHTCQPPHRCAACRSWRSRRQWSRQRHPCPRRSSRPRPAAPPGSWAGACAGALRAHAALAPALGAPPPQLKQHSLMRTPVLRVLDFTDCVQQLPRALRWRDGGERRGRPRLGLRPMRMKMASL